MAYIQTLPRQDLRRYRFAINTANLGIQNLGPLPEGWSANLRFWPMTIHFALGSGAAWMTFPALTVGANALSNNIISVAVALPNTVENQIVRIPTVAGAAGSVLIQTLDNVLVNVTGTGSVAGLFAPMISMDIVGYWEFLTGTSVI